MDFNNIIFRGQLSSAKTWIFGDLEHSAVGMYISVNINTWHLHDDPIIDWGSYFYIESKTVGVNFGHKDINGKLIFTGDIIQDNENRIYIVIFDGRTLYLESKKYMNIGITEENVVERGFLVIGNIYDNPELLNK